MLEGVSRAGVDSSHLAWTQADRQAFSAHLLVMAGQSCDVHFSLKI